MLLMVTCKGFVDAVAKALLLLVLLMVRNLEISAASCNFDILAIDLVCLMFFSFSLRVLKDEGLYIFVGSMYT